VGGKPIVASKAHRLQPELGHAVTFLDVNVRRFVALITEEEQTIGTFSQNLGHRFQCYKAEKPVATLFVFDFKAPGT
jgi:hypothetical protein